MASFHQRIEKALANEARSGRRATDAATATRPIDAFASIAAARVLDRAYAATSKSGRQSRLDTWDIIAREAGFEYPGEPKNFSVRLLTTVMGILHLKIPCITFVLARARVL